MTISQILSIFLIVVSILLTISVLLQSKGVGLSATFGGGGDFYRSRRGAEKILYYATIGLAAILFVISVTLLILS